MPIDSWLSGQGTGYLLYHCPKAALPKGTLFSRSRATRGTEGSSRQTATNRRKQNSNLGASHSIASNWQAETASKTAVLAQRKPTLGNVQEAAGQPLQG